MQKVSDTDNHRDRNDADLLISSAANEMQLEDVSLQKVSADGCKENDKFFVENVAVGDNFLLEKHKRKHRPRKRNPKKCEESVIGWNVQLGHSLSHKELSPTAVANDVSLLSLSSDVTITKKKNEKDIPDCKIVKATKKAKTQVRKMTKKVAIRKLHDGVNLKDNNAEVLNCPVKTGSTSTKCNSVGLDESITRHSMDRMEGNNKKNPVKSSKKSKDKPKILRFGKHISRSEAEEGLCNGTLIKGIIRINQRNYKEAFISDVDGCIDILISGVKDRNQALEGDEVVVQLKQPAEWKAHRSGVVQKTGQVVAIYSHNHPKLAVGILKHMTAETSPYASFVPRDSRIPRLKIPLHSCPINFLQFPEKYENILVLVRMVEWNDVSCAIGELIEELGSAGDVQAETAAILQENGLDVENYPEDMKKYYPASPYQLNEEEIKKRADLRKECIFTIDPKTAKDLDDAVSCKLLENGNFEVGVHISDVTYFLHPDTPLDEAVCRKATSIYLVDAVHHMLPRDLCLMCSLTPGEDKLTFSVIWEITTDAKIISCRIMRSVVNSCVQLSYEQVQAVIENPGKEWIEDDFPPIKGNFKPSEIAHTALLLHKLAVKIRARRFEGGALRIDQIKIGFSLDQSGMPFEFHTYINKDSNRLIEEFMLLANMAVAEHLHAHFPSLAFLRCHPKPASYLLKDLKSSFEKRGIHLDVSSAGSLQASLCQYEGNDFISKSRFMVIVSLCARAMSRAKYFRSDVMTDFEEYRHYALNVPLYTHFTSPIRRYADVMVHRLLGASLGYHEKPNWTENFVEKIAENCNKQKYAAKLAGEQSTKLFLTIYVKSHGPVIDDAVVVAVLDHSFDVLVLSFGINQRIYVDKMDVRVFHEREDSVSVLKIMWKPTLDYPYETYQVIETFSLVRVKLVCPDQQFRIQLELMRPGVPETIVP